MKPEEEKLGRVTEDAGAERDLVLNWKVGTKGGGGSRLRLPRVADRTQAGPLRSTRPVSADGRVTFHFRHTFISRFPSKDPRPGLAFRTEDGRQVRLDGMGSGWKSGALENAYGGDFREARATVLSDVGSPAKPARGGAMKTITEVANGARAGAKTWGDVAQALTERGISLVRAGPVVSKQARPSGSAAAHQKYIERDGAQETDEDGLPGEAGTIGETRAERIAFWGRVEELERDNARVQCRLVVELPFELTAKERRELVHEFAGLFRERDLLHHAVIHRPDEKNDRRNFHVHLIYHDRPGKRAGRGEWRFRAAKDRGSQGAAWIRELRKRYADLANAYLERGGHAKRYDPRTYEEMGITKRPGRHLGPAAAALQRQGVSTEAGRENEARERTYSQEGGLDRRGRRVDHILERLERIEQLPEGRFPEVDSVKRRLEERVDEWADLALSREGLSERSLGAAPDPAPPLAAPGSARDLRASEVALVAVEDEWRATNLLSEREEVHRNLQALEDASTDDRVTPEAWEVEKKRLKREAERFEAEDAAALAVLVDRLTPQAGSEGEARDLAERLVTRPDDGTDEGSHSGIDEALLRQLSEPIEDAVRARDIARRRRAELRRRERIERRGEIGGFVRLPEDAMEEGERRRRLANRLREIDREIVADPAALALADSRGIGKAVRQSAAEPRREKSVERD